MRTKTKALALSLCAVLLVVTTVFVTMAFLTSQDSVTNTFTVGRVAITLDELDVDNDANKDDNVTVDGATRDKANKYKLIPGKGYTKDPIVHVAADSEKCYVFVTVTNGISAIEAATVEGGYTGITEQVKANGWAELKDGETLIAYYKTVDPAQEDADLELEVFGNFKIADHVSNEVIANYVTESNSASLIEVKAYAIQFDGFENNVLSAWTTVSAASNN